MRYFSISIIYIAILTVNHSNAQNIDLSSSDTYIANEIYKAKYKNGFATVPEKYRKLAEGESFEGGVGINHIYNFNLNSLLSINNQFVYIPLDSYIIFHFKQGIKKIEGSIELLIQSCDDPCGCGMNKPDSALVSVSRKGRRFIDLGIIKTKETKTYDFNDYEIDKIIHFVKVEGISTSDYPYGFELMNVVAFWNQPVMKEELQTVIHENDSAPRLIVEHFMLPDLLFELNRSTIDQNQLHILDSVYSRTTEILIEKILISGHTDDTGSNDYNNKLSLSRANAIKEYFLEKGIDEDLIITKGYGETKHLPDMDSGDYRNRRVEIEIIIKN